MRIRSILPLLVSLWTVALADDQVAATTAPVFPVLGEIYGYTHQGVDPTPMQILRYEGNGWYEVRFNGVAATAMYNLSAIAGLLEMPERPPKVPPKANPPAGEIPRIKIGGRYSIREALVGPSTGPYWCEVLSYGGDGWYRVQELVVPWAKGPQPERKFWINFGRLASFQEQYFK